MSENNAALPVLIYDGDCAFCKLWIERWRLQTGAKVDYRPFQQAARDYPDIPRKAFRQGVHLISPGGEVTRNAEAVFTLLAEYADDRLPFWLYDRVPGFAPFSELIYRIAERSRSVLYNITTAVRGKSLEPASYRVSRWLFLRALGLVYFFAFFTLTYQIKGLVGSDGILPASDFLQRVHAFLGPDATSTVTTVFWLNSSDAALVGVTVAGSLLAVCLTVGLIQQIAAVALYILYMSIFWVGQDFLGFQWDVLLLEAGFLAIFLAPAHLLPKLPRGESEPSHAMIWMVRWLLFRLMFGSGMVKLLSGDPSWHNFTALSYHYYTQPLPNPVAWLFNQFPPGFQQASTRVALIIELGFPWLILLPRRLRFAGGAGIIGIQCLIGLTGNYTFFNLLTLAMCILLFDDLALRSIVPARIKARFAGAWQPSRRAIWKQAVVAIAAIPILVGSLIIFLREVSPTRYYPPEPVADMTDWLSQHLVINTYGLFAVMTTTRPEIIIEGSDDGQNWKAYEFPFKPGDPRRPPPIVAPLQPRLDWQMWFAALGDYRSNGWFVPMMGKLLQGSPDVLALFANNPFPDHPPRYVRAELYDYHFSDFQTLQSQGVWWVRTPQGEYLPVMSSGANLIPDHPHP